MRTCSSIMEFDDNKDYISDMVADKERKHLLCTRSAVFLFNFI